MSDLTSALEALRDAAETYEEADEYSEGRAPEVFASGSLRKKLAAQSLKFRVNWARTTITEVLDRLELNAITCNDPAMQEAWDRAWSDNNLALEAYGIHDEALTHGDHYVIVWDGDDDGDVTIDSNSALNVRLFYREDNPRKIKFGVKAWQRADRRQRVDLYYEELVDGNGVVVQPRVVEKWITKLPVTKASKINDADFEHYLTDEEDPESWLVLNPYSRVPIFHFRTELPYGRPEHRDAYGPQNALNKLVVTHMSTVDFQGWPQRWALTEKTGKVGDEAPADEFFTDDDDAPTSSGASSQHVVAEPGGTQWYDDVKSVGQFDAAPPATFLEPITAYVGHMATVTKTALHAYQLGGQPPTGESRRRAEAPTVKKTMRRQLAFGATWRDVAAFALEVAGFSPDEVEAAGLIMVEWEPAQLADDAEGFALIEAKVAAGVPRYVALLEAGYTARQLATWGLEPPAAGQVAAPVAQQDELDAATLDDTTGQVPGDKSAATAQGSVR